LGAAGGFHYWRRAKLAARDAAPEVPQLLEPVPAELRPLINNVTLPFATDGIEGDPDPHPSAVIDRGAIYVGVTQVGLVEPLQHSGRPQRVDDLFTSLKSQGESWKAAHPGQDFYGVVEYWIDENTSALVVKSVFQTGAFAGFPNMRFAARSRSHPLRIVMVPAYARVPGPPGAVDPNPPTRVLAARLRPDDLVELAWASQGLETLERTGLLKDVGAATKALWGSRPPAASPQSDRPTQEDAIVIVPNEAPFSKVMQLLDGLYELTVPVAPGSTDQHPAFAASLRVNIPDHSAKELADEYLARPNPPRIRFGETAIRGRLEPEKIQATVRRSFASMRACYEKGLGKNADLAGRVSVRFVIGRDGKVTRAEASPESTLPDPAVQRCIAHAFQSLEFPPPEGGIVTVVYPIVLEPG
jgi:hypothetical protein